MTLIDSHCHLDFPDFADEIEDVVARAEAAGVERMTTVSTRVAQADGLRAIAERFPSVYFTVGTHPHHAAEFAGADRTHDGGHDRVESVEFHADKNADF